MFNKITLLNSKTHANKKILPVNSFKFAKKSYIASLMINEFTTAAPIYPILFIKEGENLRPFALLGLKSGENLFVDDTGKWNANYIPAIIRRYPFMLGRVEGKDDLRLCIDEESEFLSEDKGEPLFDDEGKPSQIIENAKKYLGELHGFSEVTDRFTKELEQHGLLSMLNIQLKDNTGKARNIEGCFGVNEKKFNEISDESFLQFRKRGILPLIYAHLMSLSQITRLVQFEAEK